MNRRYLDLYEDIKNSIVEGNYRPGEKLPSENEFCRMYGTSRGTVRKALDLLAEEGLIHSLHGKGVFVLEHNLITFSFGGIVSFKEAAETSGLKFTTSVSKFEEVMIDEALSARTNLPPGKAAYKIFRVRKLDGERVILDINFFLKDVAAGLSKEIAEQSIYEYIEGELQLKIGFAKRIIHVEPATSADKAHLDLKGYNLVAVVKNFVHLHDGTPFEYTESRHRPDRFEFTNFARRR
ncbi:trehalose operon repressor [Effusibacillus consociatus]|uniref:Trehalose operon repressor n=1 Tax=Effusibacillus consociatus TaxID=1117041 RepID=A0ABV9Q007_9BACL